MRDLPVCEYRLSEKHHHTRNERNGELCQAFCLGCLYRCPGRRKAGKSCISCEGSILAQWPAIVKSRDGSKALFFCHRVDVHPPTSAIEPDVPVDQSENCVIASQANVFAGQKFRSALAHNNIPGNHKFVSELLHPEPFANAVATVLYAALSLLMSHC